MTNTGDTIAIGAEPNNVNCAPGSASAVVTNRSAGDARSYTTPPLAGPVSTQGLTGGFGISAVINAAGTVLYERSINGGNIDAFSYNQATGVIGASLGGFPQPIGPTNTPFGMDQMALHPDGTKLYASQAGSVEVFNAATGAFITSITDNSIVDPFGICFAGGASAIPVDIDIKFCSDPNAFNCKKKGVVPVTIFGNGIDVADIDVESLRLCLASDTSMCTASGPKSSSVADRGDPTTDIGADSCAIDPLTGEELNFLNQDGIDDLDVAFFAQEVAALIGCDGLSKNDPSATLVIVGQTNGGAPIESIPVGDIGIDQLVKKNK